MAILNATPDSFSDGGKLTALDEDAMRQRIWELLDAGADILDVGGESTRPGHADVPDHEEIRRVVPVIQAIRAEAPHAVVSIDTRKANVARAALEAGADLLNDVSGLSDPGMAKLAAETGCGIILMRHQDCGLDIVEEACQQLQAICHQALDAGVMPQAIVVDPGLGFGAHPGSDPAANLALIDASAELQKRLGHPVLVGASRKRFIGQLTGDPDPAGERRVAGSVEVAVRAAQAGAAILRVHDVAPTVAALQEAGFRQS